MRAAKLEARWPVLTEQVKRTEESVDWLQQRCGAGFFRWTLRWTPTKEHRSTAAEAVQQAMQQVGAMAVMPEGAEQEQEIGLVQNRVARVALSEVCVWLCDKWKAMDRDVDELLDAKDDLEKEMHEERWRQHQE